MLRSLLAYALWGGAFLVFIAAGALGYIYSGIYDISAITQHTLPVYWPLSTARRQAIRSHAAGETPPADLSDASLLAAGRALFDRHCLQCHGAPGIAPSAFALGMTPFPPNFAQMGRDLPPQEIYWAVTNGIKLTGMPAWKYRLTESERWSIAAFVKSAVHLTASENLDQRPASHPTPSDGSAIEVSGLTASPDDRAEQGRTAIQQYACASCHVIPGIRGPDADVGPPLGGIASQVYLAGILPNTPDHMVEWIRDPQRLKPRSAMPNLGVTERDAGDIAAYLSTLR